MNLERLLFTRANIENVEELLVIIHRCMNEVNYKDYTPYEFEKYLAHFTADWLIDIINNDIIMKCGIREKSLPAAELAGITVKKNKAILLQFL